MGEKPKEKVLKLSQAEDFALSGAAAIISKTAAAPIERVKLLIQNQDEMMKAGRLDVPYKGIGDCVQRTMVNEGVWSFWRGNVANCIRYFPTQALNFTLKNTFKVMFPYSKSDPFYQRLGMNVMSGGCGAVVSLMLVYSLDYARTRLANDAKMASKGGAVATRQFDGMFDVYRKTFASDGMFGLYRGFVISAVGIFVYRGIYFGLFDTVIPHFADSNDLVKFMIGYAVTVFAGLCSYPFDTIRRRIMMTSGEAVKYNGSMDCLLQICRKEGPQSLMKGATANIVRGVAGASVLYFFNVGTEMLLRYKNDEPIFK